jgi:L-ascorbate metabolism protein UlaG (beta-lactamase superfamily)
VVLTEKNSARALGFARNLKVLEAGESMSFGDFKFSAVEAYNYKRFRSPGQPFHPKGFGLGFLINLGRKVFYHAGDTDDIEEMKDISNVHVAFLPIGGTYTMDINDAVNALSTIEPKFAVPIHYNFIKGTEANPEDFKEKAKFSAVSEVLIL